MTRLVAYELPEYLAARRAAHRSDRLIQVAACAVALAAVLGSALLVPAMNRLRQQYHMVIDPSTIAGLPPLESLLAKTATLRALAIDVAFIRSERLKEVGKYYEAMQLADWICKLAPRFPSVWSFHAWNQAYNISVGTYTAEERWKWVSNGLRLLRDEGIQYNPESITLYKELAFIYWHKIGDFLDDHHWNYKKELGVEMERVLGPPVPAVQEREVIDTFRQITGAPPPDELPHWLQTEPEIAAWVAKLAEVDLAPDDRLLEFVARYVRDDVSVSRYLKSVTAEEAQSLQARRVALLSEPATTGPRDRLLAALRRRVLETRYHMDVGWMLQLMEKYGPIDWRSPYALALYWASWGDMRTRGVINLNPNDSMNTARFIMFALKNMVERGRLILVPDFEVPNRSYISLLPDLRFIDHLHEAFLELSQAQFGDQPDYRPGEAAGNYRNGHFTFLNEAIHALYVAGDEESLRKAQYYYDYLRRVNREPDGRPKAMYLGPLEEFVLGDLMEDAEGFRRANAYVGGLMLRSFQELALGDPERSVAAAQRANDIYQHFMKEIAADDRLDRRKLEKIAVIRRDAAIDYLTSPYELPLHKARVWAGLELLTRQGAWDEVEPFLAKMCAEQVPPWDITKAFPEPPGMDEYRANPVLERRREASDAEEGTQDRSAYE